MRNSATISQPACPEIGKCDLLRSIAYHLPTIRISLILYFAEASDSQFCCFSKVSRGSIFRDKRTTTQTPFKPFYMSSGSRTCQSAAPVVFCHMRFPFMFAILHAFILMEALAERPQRLNYSMISNALDLDQNVAKLQGVSECKSLKSEDTCKLGSGCDWKRKCNKHQQCEWFSKKTSCNELKQCRLSVQTWHRLGGRGVDATPHYQAHEELPECLRQLGFKAFPKGYGEEPFVVKSTCKPVQNGIFTSANPLDCIPPSGVVATLEVIQPEIWESKNKNIDILKCTWYKRWSFSKHCLDGWTKGGNPPGVNPQSGKTKTKHEKQGTTSWTPILFVRFEDSETILPDLKLHQQPFRP